ncbi:Ada metal-binding domain-containing protein [Terrimonas pollutisoli]|uniref:Ada metal-binding domain-containing protein n=1 Tax=Terrimonas pollutisoli TaxID=3034147 RepID=UPI0023EB41EC|nr:Ada metal-binding domain-containing protein [Terrimonas sp. H1YJ31]
MEKHSNISDAELRTLIRNHSILLGGNSQLKIFGKLNCRSGKRMKKINRVFFASKQEAIEQGYRPCGHCMNKEYKAWKNGTI